MKMVVFLWKKAGVFEMDSPSNKDVICYKCNSKLDLEPAQKILRHDECEKCKAYLHCCKMCQYYDVSSYNDCRESNAERIVEKETPNFCSYYILMAGNGKTGPSKDEQLNALNSLFKN